MCGMVVIGDILFGTRSIFSRFRICFPRSVLHPSRFVVAACTFPLISCSRLCCDDLLLSHSPLVLYQLSLSMEILYEITACVPKHCSLASRIRSAMLISSLPQGLFYKGRQVDTATLITSSLHVLQYTRELWINGLAPALSRDYLQSTHDIVIGEPNGHSQHRCTESLPKSMLHEIDNSSLLSRLLACEALENVSLDYHGSFLVKLRYLPPGLKSLSLVCVTPTDHSLSTMGILGILRTISPLSITCCKFYYQKAVYFNPY